MYTSSNLIFYSESNMAFAEDVRSVIIECDIPFKNIINPQLISQMIKNQQNYVVLLINSKEFLQSIEKSARFCHNFQNRVFIVYSSSDLVDYFFDNFCLLQQLDVLKSFILNNVVAKNIKPPHKTSSLLRKLISGELKNLGISDKYIGFEYLISIIMNAFSKNFYVNNYIDLFEYVACANFTKIDTVERDVRHMLVKTWNNNERFREILSASNIINKPNSKTLLKAVLNHLKKVI